MKTMKKPTFIPITEEGLDDLFIYKHLWEKENRLENHVPLMKFITEKANLGGKAFRCGKTDNVIPFGTFKVGDNIVFIYTPSDEKTEEAFFEKLESCGYDVTKLTKHDITNFDVDIDSLDFVTVNGKELLI
jgi:hypothetical protein